MYTVNVVLPWADSQPNTQINVVFPLSDTNTNYQCFTCTILIQNYNLLPMFYDYLFHHPGMNLALSDGPETVKIIEND